MYRRKKHEYDAPRNGSIIIVFHLRAVVGWFGLFGQCGRSHEGEARKDDVVDDDLILVRGDQKRIITGSDLLGRLLRGIVMRDAERNEIIRRGILAKQSLSNTALIYLSLFFVPDSLHYQYWPNSDFRYGPVWRLNLKPTPIPDARAVVPTSVVLQRLHEEAPTDHFTLGWLMGSLHERSFGIIMLLLALGRDRPGRINRRRRAAHDPGVPDDCGPACSVLSTLHLRPSVADATPRRFGPASRASAEISGEVIHPRWPTPFEATKRLVGLGRGDF